MKVQSNIKPFMPVEGGYVITVSKGIQRQVDLYKREKLLYAKHGGGFIRLMQDGSTSVTTSIRSPVTWIGLSGVNFKVDPKFNKQVEASK